MVVIHVDARDFGAGAFLAQQNADDLSIIAYFNNASTIAKNTIWPQRMFCRAMQWYWQYSTGDPICGENILCVTDHAALRYFYSVPRHE